MRYLTLILLLLALQANSQGVTESLNIDQESFPRIGIIADCQYADKPTQGVRHYRLSSQKLAACVEKLNALQLDHVFHLGDFIDQHRKSFEVVMPIMNSLEAPFTHVLGNHDFSVEDQFKEEVPKYMGLNQRYFSLKIRGWKFIILDGNDVSLYTWPAGSPMHEQSAKIYQENYSNRKEWNGAIGETQLQWLKMQLQQAEMNSEKVILLCHFPLLPVDQHVLWNDQEVLDLITGFSCVKAWFNGHNHAGGYVVHKGIHFVTFQGMVNTEQTSYATVLLEDNKMVITGIGREEDRKLDL